MPPSEDCRLTDKADVEHHTPITADEIARTFDEEVAPVELSSYTVEDWATLIHLLADVRLRVLQFFTRYVLNNSFA